MLNLYEKLQASPLFNGLTSDNLTQIIGQTRFSFSKYEPQQIIKKEGAPCSELTLLINGTLTRKTAADDRSYSVEETEEAPYVMQPERFFGLTQSYSSDFTAMTVCDTLSISKDDVMRLSDEFIIFRLNLVGIVSTVAQKAQRNAWRTFKNDTHGRIIGFLRSHVIKPSGPKTVRIKMTRLASETGESRLKISEELNRLQDNGLLSFSRGIITIPSFEKLMINN